MSRRHPARVSKATRDWIKAGRPSEASLCEASPVDSERNTGGCGPCGGEFCPDGTCSTCQAG